MSTTPTTTTSAGPRLSGHLGVAAIVFMVIAAAAPLTVIGGNVALSISLGNGAGAPAGFLIATVVLLLFSVGFVAMTPFVHQAGAFYAYVARGLGDRAGLATAFLALVTYTAIQVAVWGYLGGVVRDLVARYGGPDVPWPVYTALVLLLVAALGHRHIDVSAKVLGVALVAEILIVVAMDLAIITRGGAEGLSLSPFSPAEVFSGPLGIAVLFSVTGFIGFEATAVFRDEARDPERTIPRATYLAVTVIGVFYTVSSWAMVQAWGNEGAVEAATSDTGGFMLNTAQDYLGTVLRDVMEVLLVTSLFACVLSFHNVVARYQFTLARRGVLPAALATVHPVHRSPSTSSHVQSVTAALLIALCAVLGLEPLVQVFSTFAGIATLGIVLLMGLTSTAVLVFFARRPAGEGGSALTTRVAPVLALVGLLATLWLVVSNFPLVVAGSTGLAVALGAVPVLALVVGAVAAGRLRARGTTLLQD